MDQSLTILEQLKVASFTEVFLVSLLMLPFYLGFWSLLVKELSDRIAFKRAFYSVVAVLYFVAIAVLKYGDFEHKKYTAAEMRIKAFLRDQQWDAIGFNRIRDNIDKTYDDDFLREMVELVPEFTVTPLLPTAADPADTIGIKFIYESDELNYGIATIRIKEEIEQNNLTAIGFKRIRTNIDSRYNDEFLEELCERNTHLFDRIPLNDTNDVMGIRLLPAVNP